MLVLAKGVSTIYTANIASNSISMIERVPGPEGWKETVIPVGKGPEGCDLSPDGKEFWTANSGDGTVSIIDVPGKKVARVIEIGTKRSNRLKFTPDGKQVLVSDLNAGELVVLDAASRRLTKRVTIGKSAAGILVAPDGSKAYVAATADGKVAIVDLKTLAVAGEITTGRGPDGMAWVGR